MNVIPQWLVAQYNRAKKNGWLPYFEEGATKYDFATSDLLGLASRESNLQNIKGDFHDGVYHGFSLMQLDINSYGAWIRSGKWEDPREAILKGCEALAAKREQIVKASKLKTATIKFRSGKIARFTPKPFTDEQLRQMTLAAYNCGLAAYYHFSIGNSIDAGTTGKNYSKDVLKRSQDFKDLMARDTLGKTANDRVIEPTPGDTGNQVLHPEPIPQADKTSFPFGKVEEKYEKHADLLQRESTKSIAKRVALKLGSGVMMIWGTTTGKVALVLTGTLVVGIATFYVVKYRHLIATFFIELKDYIRGKF